MFLEECSTDRTNIYLVGEDYRKKEKKGLVRQIFRKNFNHAEIIGEELCGIRNLSCPHFFLMADTRNNDNRYATYKVAKKEGLSIKLGSYDVKKEGVYYFSLNDISSSEGKTKFEDLLSFAPSAKNREELANELCELFALDLFMGQIDRFSNNLLFSFNINNGEIHLVSIFDFQYSLKSCYNSEDNIYDNQVYPFKTIGDFKDFIIFFPSLSEKLKDYLDVDLVGIAEEAYDKRGLFIPDEKVHYFDEFSQNRKELIKRIIL